MGDYFDMWDFISLYNYIIHINNINELVIYFDYSCEFLFIFCTVLWYIIVVLKYELKYVIVTKIIQE